MRGFSRSAGRCGGIQRSGCADISGGRGRLGEIIPLAQLPVNAAGYECGRRPFHSPRVPTDKDHQRNLWVMLVGVGGKPANPRSGLMVRARSGFAKRLLVALAIKTRLAGSVEYRREHPFAELRKPRLDIQLALDARPELIPLFRVSR